MQGSQMDSTRDHWKPRSEDLPPSEVDLDWVHAKISEGGLVIVEGPFLNREYLAARGQVMIRVKCLLSPALLLFFTNRRAQEPQKANLRFLVNGDRLEFVSTSGRKKSSTQYRQYRKNK